MGFENSNGTKYKEEIDHYSLNANNIKNSQTSV